MFAYREEAYALEPFHLQCHVSASHFKYRGFNHTNASCFSNIHSELSFLPETHGQYTGKINGDKTITYLFISTLREEWSAILSVVLESDRKVHHSF